jgi:hypothetical protein
MTKEKITQTVNETTSPDDPFFVSEDETKQAYLVPATLINRFVLHWDNNGARLAFGEQSLPTTPVAYRTAIVMSMPTVISLYELLQRMLKDAKIPLDEDLNNG